MASFSKLRRLASSALDNLLPGQPTPLSSFIPTLASQIDGWLALPSQPAVLDRSGFGVQQLRWYSRPRGPLWRGKKGIGKEALYVLGNVKRLKNDSVRLGNLMQTKVARLLKTDLLAVLRELQRQNEVDLALRVFNMARREVWYKPDVYLYKDMLSCLAYNQRVTDCEAILNDLKKEGIKPDDLLLTEIMTAYLECRMVPQAMEIFEQMRKGSCPPDRPAFKVLLRYLKKLGKRELRLKIRKEYLEFYEGVEEGGEEYSRKMKDDSEGMKDESEDSDGEEYNRKMKEDSDETDESEDSDD